MYENMYIIKPKWKYEIYMNLEFSCDSSPSIEVKQPNHFAKRFPLVKGTRERICGRLRH